jgi:hypothetical protein
MRILLGDNPDGAAVMQAGKGYPTYNTKQEI